MPDRTFLAFLVTPLLLVGLGCSSGSESNVDVQSGNPVDESGFLNAYSDLACDGMQRCCTEAGFGFDAGFCALLTSGSSSGSTSQTFSEAQAGLCLQQMANSTLCDGSDTPACQDIYVGTLEAGSACQQDGECKAPVGGAASCDFMRQICVAEQRGTEGSTCHRSCTEADGGRGCSYDANVDTDTLTTLVDCYSNDGLYCAASDSTCKKFGELGQACEGDASCNAGLYCPMDGAEAPTCQAQLAVGAACDFVVPCVATANCVDSVCVTKKAVGESCTSFDECLGSCDCGDSGDCSAGGICVELGAGLDALGGAITEALCTGNVSGA